MAAPGDHGRGARGGGEIGMMKAAPRCRLSFDLPQILGVFIIPAWGDKQKLLNYLFAVQPMILRTPYEPSEVVTILKDQVDRLPSFLRCLFTLNAHRFRGTSPVCGTVRETGFELRNRKDPFLSLRATGLFIKVPEGAEIEIRFKKPMFQDVFGIILFRRYEDDQKVILSFLEEWLKTKKKAGTKRVKSLSLTKAMSRRGDGRRGGTSIKL